MDQYSLRINPSKIKNEDAKKRMLEMILSEEAVKLIHGEIYMCLTNGINDLQLFCKTITHVHCETITVSGPDRYGNNTVYNVRAVNCAHNCNPTECFMSEVTTMPNGGKFYY